MEPTGAWDRERTEAFLDRQTIPLRLSCRRPDGDPWMLSLWYCYREGALWSDSVEPSLDSLAVVVVGSSLIHHRTVG